MTTKQLRKLKMYLVVREFLTHNEDVMNNVPHFKESFSEFRSLIEDIHLASQDQSISRKGIAIDKKKRREGVISIALDTARKLTAFASTTNNMRLFEQVHLSFTDLDDLRDVDLRSTAGIIYKEAEAKTGLLKEYLISAETQSEFREAIDKFDESLSKPRLGISEKRQATIRLDELMGKAYSVLLDIDTEEGIIMYDEPDFHTGYKSARKLVYTRAGRLALRASVKEMITGVPVKGVVLKFTADGLTGKKNDKHTVIVKKSARKGGLQIHNMPEGTYIVVIKKPGYKEKITSVTVADGERSELVVELEKT